MLKYTIQHWCSFAGGQRSQTLDKRINDRKHLFPSNLKFCRQRKSAFRFFWWTRYREGLVERTRPSIVWISSSPGAYEDAWLRGWNTIGLYVVLSWHRPKLFLILAKTWSPGTGLTRLDRSSASRRLATSIHSVSMFGFGMLKVRRSESITTIRSSTGSAAASWMMSFVPIHTLRTIQGLGCHHRGQYQQIRDDKKSCWHWIIYSTQSKGLFISVSFLK